MQTQCPQCHTAFRVSAEQLELADGKVRCGQCLHVFVANEHFIDEPPAEDIASLATDKITMLDIETSSRLAEIELEASEVELPGKLSTDELIPNEIELAEIEIDDIEMPSLEALNDGVEERAETEATEHLFEAPPATPTDTPLETPSETTGTEDSVETSTDVHAIAEPLPAANEAWLEEDREAELAAAEAIRAMEEQADREQELAEQAAGIPETPDQNEAIPLLVESFDASQLYPELDAAPPVEQAQHTGLYSLAIIVLLAVFLLQGTYALRDTLAGQPALRPLMGDFCAAFDCALTLPREPKKVLLTRSEVRSHPAQNGALLVKASIQNQARFRQAYPILRLQFSDLDGQPLLGRDFMPEEYLPDDVNIKAGMPINTDVNLSLELVDPGGQAVSFDFNLL